jgi:hypothetical protein
MGMDKWMDKWVSDPDHKVKREKIFQSVYEYTGDVGIMLEIGCGLARESECYQKKCGTELYLLDGDVSETEDNKREIHYGEADSFKFYTPISELKSSYDERGMKYTFVDANNIDIPEDVKFDLIYSSKSCGFHYPASTYKELVRKHSHENTKVIFDVRTDPKQKDISIKKILFRDKISAYAEIEFL